MADDGRSVGAVPDEKPRMHRSHRVAGALVGAAVGDALGAPFAGSPPGGFSRRFPVPARGVRTEMCGDDPGRFTDGFAATLEALAARGLRSRGNEGRESHDFADLGEAVGSALDGEVPAELGDARGFAHVMSRVIDEGGETSTRAAAAGALAGAVFGMAGIPMRWSSVVHGPAAGRTWRLHDLQEFAAALDGRAAPPYDPGHIPRIGPTEVLPGIWAGNLDGARYSDSTFAVISLCRLGEPFGHEVQRMAYVSDDDYNTELDVVLEDVLADIAALRAEGRRILVHCHGGASRTGLVLRAWLRRTEGLSADEATRVVAERWPYLGLWNASFTAALERMT
jgi:Dual specificity phosphatase, catalytic domain/ADP-ribosylglycohydrolase